MPTHLLPGYAIILQQLKTKIKAARQKAVLAINTELLFVYWEIGKAIADQESIAGWGSKVIETLAGDLRSEFPEMKGFSLRNLRYMRDFAKAYPHFLMLQQPAATLQTNDNKELIILQQAVAKLPWGHHSLILNKTKAPGERAFYIVKAVENGWSRNVLAHQIESRLFEAQGSLINNFQNTLPSIESDLTRQIFKDPYNFDFIMLGEEARERDLEDALIAHITKVLLELGAGFALVGRQNRFEAGGKEFFTDLLFYHTKMRRYIIIELKIGEFEPEFVSKMHLYLNIADDTLKGEYDNPSIGLILCKTKNKIVAEYALRDTGKPIGIAAYKIAERLPDNIRGELPSIEEIETRLDEELKEPEKQLDTRLKAIKEKLKGMKGEEVQTAATYPILLGIYSDGLRLLYNELLDQLSSLNDLFQEQNYYWYSIGSDNKTLQSITALAEAWSSEEVIRNTREIQFSHNFRTLKKAGTENSGIHFTLNFVMDTYWYGFTLMNYNNQQPFLKKLYHQSLNKNDRDRIIELIMNKACDDIDHMIGQLNEAEKKK
jgi:predicted nuclease of restriction endonuclease-like (RecB) superfamily